MAARKKTRGKGLVPRLIKLNAISSLLSRSDRKTYLKDQTRIEKLVLRVEALSLKEMKVDARVELVSQVLKTNRAVLYMGDSSVYSVVSPAGTLRWLHNGKFLSVRFPSRLGFKQRVGLTIRYKYYPDRHGGMVFPASNNLDFTVRSTVFHPVSFRAVSQGKLLSESRKRDGMVTEWEHPRSHRLNLIYCSNVDRMERTQDDVAFSLYIQKENRENADKIFDICIKTYLEQVAQHGRLDHGSYTFVEADAKDDMAFNGRGLVVVNNGSFAKLDEPRLYGILTHEISKEWLRKRR